MTRILSDAYRKKVMSAEEAAKLSIEEFLANPDHEFETIVTEIIEEHRDALERLAR